MQRNITWYNIWIILCHVCSEILNLFYWKFVYVFYCVGCTTFLEKLTDSSLTPVISKLRRSKLYIHFIGNIF